MLVAVADELDVLGSPRRFVESAIWLLIVRSLYQARKVVLCHVPFHTVLLYHVNTAPTLVVHLPVMFDKMKWDMLTGVKQI